MNDLMTKSFLNYVELNKQQSLHDVEDPTPIAQQQLAEFFKEIGALQCSMDEISVLLIDLRRLHNATKSSAPRSANILRGLRDQMESNMLAILNKATTTKSTIQSLTTNTTKGSPVDRTKNAVISGLKFKLKNTMHEFQTLREQIALTSSSSSSSSSSSYVNKEDEKGVVELQRSLSRLQQVFVDMALLVEAQQDNLDDIERNVVCADSYVGGGTEGLRMAEPLRRKGRKLETWVWCVWGLVLLLLLVCLLPLLSGSLY